MKILVAGGRFLEQSKFFALVSDFFTWCQRVGGVVCSGNVGVFKALAVDDVYSQRCICVSLDTLPCFAILAPTDELTYGV